MAREPKIRLDGQEPDLKPWLGPEIEKHEDYQEMSHEWVPWHTGAKFFKSVLKIFERK